MKFKNLNHLDLSNISEEMTIPPDPVQRAVIAFSCKGGGVVLWCQGEVLENEVDNLSTNADELGITDNKSPEEGIWIWEGTFNYWQDYEGEWDVTTNTIQWRKPTDEEWNRIKNSSNPFQPYCPNCDNLIEGQQCSKCGYFLSDLNSN